MRSPSSPWPPESATVREAGAADLPVLVRLLDLLFSLETDFRPDPRRQRRGLELMLEDREQRRVLVAEVAGVVRGMATAQLLVSTAEGALSALVEDLVVDDGARRAGLGRRLLLGLEDWARARGATRLQLLADRDNRPALEFYRRLGWTTTQLVALRRGGVRRGLAR